MNANNILISFSVSNDSYFENKSKCSVFWNQLLICVLQKPKRISVFQITALNSQNFPSQFISFSILSPWALIYHASWLVHDILHIGFEIIDFGLWNIYVWDRPRIFDLHSWSSFVQLRASPGKCSVSWFLDADTKVRRLITYGNFKEFCTLWINHCIAKTSGLFTGKLLGNFPDVKKV